MCDCRKASSLIRKGQAVLGYASAMDREHFALPRPIARLRTCHTNVTKRHREGDWQLESIFIAKLFQRPQHTPDARYGTPFHSYKVSRARLRSSVRVISVFP